MVGSEGREGGVQRRQVLRTGAALVPAAWAASAGEAFAAADGPVKPRRTRIEDWTEVAEAFGRPGTVTHHAYYHTRFARTDLDVECQGVQVTPGLALGSHASFAPYYDGSSLLMGDMVVPESALQRFLEDLFAAGVMLSAVHKHLPAHEPSLWWVHGCAVTRNPAELAAALRTAFERSGTPPYVPDPPSTGPKSIDLDTAGINRALHTTGSINGDVFSVAFARREQVVESGRILPNGLGAITASNFQPLGGGRAAVSGDFAMVGAEVQGALEALRRGGLEIVSLHNHGLDDRPRLFFAHYWAVDDAVRIAAALHEAVRLTNVAPVLVG